jgi:hypothetical protein
VKAEPQQQVMLAPHHLCRPQLLGQALPKSFLEKVYVMVKFHANEVGG